MLKKHGYVIVAISIVYIGQISCVGLFTVAQYNNLNKALAGSSAQSSVTPPVNAPTQTVASLLKLEQKTTATPVTPAPNQTAAATTTAKKPTVANTPPATTPPAVMKVQLPTTTTPNTALAQTPAAVPTQITGKVMRQVKSNATTQPVVTAPLKPGASSIANDISNRPDALKNGNAPASTNIAAKTTDAPLPQTNTTTNTTVSDQNKAGTSNNTITPNRRKAKV